MAKISVAAAVRRTAALVLAAAAIAALLPLSCASRPPAAAPAAQPPVSPAPAPAKPAAPEGRQAAAVGETVAPARFLPPKERVDYLDAALADYLREVLPNGATLAIKRQPGRKTAAARIALARDPSAKAQEAGLEALALSAAAKSPSGLGAGSVALAAFEAGASIELKLEDYDDVALELVCPEAALAGLLDLVARSLASPAFSQADFDRALREARMAERREAGDPLLRSAAELRAGLYKGHPYGLPPRGTAASLAAATRDGVMRYWSSRFGAERLSVVVVCDTEPKALARRLATVLGTLPRREARAVPVAALPIRPWFRALSLSATPGSAVLRGEFGAPDPLSPDFAAMTVACAMLDDLLMERLRGESGLAYGAWARLSAAAAPSASLTVYKTGNPRAAKAAVDAAIRDLASGLCLDSGDAGGGLGPVSRSLEAYKSRAITASYAKGASSEGMAARIARDLAAGGDGTALFRIAGRIRAVEAEDLVRVARQRLLEGPSAWVALGDPDLVLGLPLSAFVPY